MGRIRSFAPLLALALASIGGHAAGATAAEPAPHAALADHLGGSFTICGRVSAYTAPVPGTDGSLVVEGVVDLGPHSFPIDETATVDPLLAGLAAAGEWTCLELVGDGMGVLTSLTIPSSSNQCGRIESAGGAVLGQRAGSTHEFTTIVLDGDAATVIAADADLERLLAALARAFDNPIMATAEACLNLSFAADGTLASIALDYDQPGGGNMAAIACGQVDGAAVSYRDPASQPYPAAGLVSVEGFDLDATLLIPAVHEVLAFHLDAGLDICLQIRVVDTDIVDAAVLTLGLPSGGRQVCGNLEVIGGLVFVDRVLVAPGLMALDFAEPTPSSIASACASLSAQEGIAVGELDICGEFQGVTQDTLVVSGVTFHFAAPVVLGLEPQPDGPQDIGIFGPFPTVPFGASNPVQIGAMGFPLGCTGDVPDAAIGPLHRSGQFVLMWLLLMPLGMAVLLGAAIRSWRAALSD